jgi:dTDP-4-dehydrorhamnose 3,5-epimerase-like enzyme
MPSPRRLVFAAHEERELGINDRFVQDNHAKSFKNTLRGLHYQEALGGLRMFLMHRPNAST